MKSINAIILSTGRELGDDQLIKKLVDSKLHKAVKMCMLNTLRQAFMELEASELDELEMPNWEGFTKEEVFEGARNRVYTEIKNLIDQMEDQMDQEVRDNKDQRYFG